MYSEWNAFFTIILLILIALDMNVAKILNYVLYHLVIVIFKVLNNGVFLWHETSNQRSANKKLLAKIPREDK